MFCSNCGESLRENVTFCSKCGQEIDIRENTKEADFTIKHKKNILIMGLGAFLIVAIVLVNFTGGGSPEDKIEDLFEAIANEDANSYLEIEVETTFSEMNRELTDEIGDDWKDVISIRTKEETDDTAIIAIEYNGESDEITVSKRDNGKWKFDDLGGIEYGLEAKTHSILAKNYIDAIKNEDTKDILKMIDSETKKSYQERVEDYNNYLIEDFGTNWIKKLKIETTMETDKRAVVEFKIDEESEEVELIKSDNGNWIMEELFY